MISIGLNIQDIFTRPNEFLPDMSGGQTEFCEVWGLRRKCIIKKRESHYYCLPSKPSFTSSAFSSEIK